MPVPVGFKPLVQKDGKYTPAPAAVTTPPPYRPSSPTSGPSGGGVGGGAPQFGSSRAAEEAQSQPSGPPASAPNYVAPTESKAVTMPPPDKSTWSQIRDQFLKAGSLVSNPARGFLPDFEDKMADIWRPVGESAGRNLNPLELISGGLAGKIMSSQNPPPAPAPGGGPSLITTVPQALIDTALLAVSAPVTAVERAIGAASQVAGVPLGNPIQKIAAAADVPSNIVKGILNGEMTSPEAALRVALGNSPTQRKQAAATLDMLAARIEQVPGIGPTLSGLFVAMKPDPREYVGNQGLTGGVLETLATARSITENAGLDPALTANLLEEIDRQMEILEPDQSRRQEVMDVVAGLQANAGFGNIPEKMLAGTFTYESPRSLIMAATQLTQGKKWEEVEREVTTQLTTQEFAQDFVTQLIIDPLNLIGGGADDLAKAAQRTAAMDTLVAVPDLQKAVGLTDQVSSGKKALGWLARETTQSQVTTHVADAIDHFSVMGRGVLNDGSVPGKLAKLGIKDSPMKALALTLAADGDEYAKGIKLADVKEALGLGARPVSEMDVAQGWAKLGDMKDLYQSRRGQNLQKIIRQGKVDGLLEKFVKADDLSKLIASGGKKINMLTVETDALGAQAEFLEAFEAATRKAMGMPELTAFEKRSAQWRTIQQVIAAGQLSPANPGMVVRDFLTDSYKRVIAGFDAFDPDALRKAAERGLSSRFSGRTAEKASESLGGSFGEKLRKFAFKSPISKVHTYENIVGGATVYNQSFDKVFATGWEQVINSPQLGAMLADLPADQALAFKNKLGTLTGKPGEIDQLMKAVDQIAPQFVQNPAIYKAGKEAGITNWIEAVNRAAAGGKEELFKQVDALRNTQMEALQKQIDEGLGSRPTYNSQALSAIDGLDVDDAMKLRIKDELNPVFREGHAYTQKARSELLDAIENLPTDKQQNEARKLLEKIGEAEDGQIGMDVAQQNAAVAAQISVAIKDGLWANGPANMLELANYGLNSPAWAKVDDPHKAWRAYIDLSRNNWHGFYMNRVGEYAAMADQMGLNTASSRLSKMAAEGVDAFMLSDRTRLGYMGEIHNLMTPNKFENRFQLLNWLKKEGFVPKKATSFGSYHIKNQQWYDDVIAKMSQHGTIKDAQAAKEAGDALKEAEVAGRAGRASLFEGAGQVIDEAKLAEQGVLYPQYDLIKGQSVQAAYRDQVLLDATEDALKNIDNPIQAGQLTADQAKSVRSWLSEAQVMHTQTQAVAQSAANAIMDLVLVNYDKTYNFDLVMGMGFNYPKWYARNLSFALQHAIKNPGAASRLIKARLELRRMNEDKPEWWKDQINLTSASGREISVPFLSSIDNLNSLWGDKFYDEEMASLNIGGIPIGELLQTAQNYGPGLNAGISIMAGALSAAGGNDELAGQFFGTIGAPTKALRALTAKVGVGGPGGFALERYMVPWLNQTDSQGNVFFAGTKYDRTRLGRALASAVEKELLTKEQAMEVMIDPKANDKYFQIVQQEAEMLVADQTLTSWLLGVGMRPREATEMKVQMMDAERGALIANRDQIINTQGIEAYRDQWYELRRKYDFMDYVVGFRGDKDERDSLYGWSVFERMPPNSADDYFVALGFEKDGAEKLINLWYERGGRYGEYTDKQGKVVPPMMEADREMLMRMFRSAGAVLSFPADPKADEWHTASINYKAIKDGLARKYGEEITMVESGYWEKQTQQARKDYLQYNPALSEYWSEKRDLMAADTIVAKYYGSIDLLEKTSLDKFEAEMAVKYPGVQPMWEHYRDLKDRGLQREASDFLRENPAMTAYLTEKNLWTLNLDEELAQMTAVLEGTGVKGWADLRSDVPETLAISQANISDLIQSSSRPMGDFELPEGYTAEETSAMIHLEIDSLSKAGKWGQVKQELAGMGLDRVFDAFTQFGNAATVTANQTKILALQAALGYIREKQGYELLTKDVDLLAASKLGASSGGRVRSVTYSSYHPGGGGGGRSGGRRGGGGKGKASAEMAAWLTNLQSSRPITWEQLRNLADMGTAERIAFLDAHPDIADLLEQAGESIREIAAYFQAQKPGKKRAPSGGKKSQVTAAAPVYQNQALRNA